MSEAENPNLPSESVEANPPEEGWTTVNFPNAIDINTIPEAEPEPSQVGLRIQDLEQQNQRLRSRVSELEFSLGEAHATLRAETKRLETQLSTQQAEAEQRSMRETHLTQQQAAMIAKQRQALDASRQRLQDQEAQIAQHLEAIATTQAEVAQLNQTLEQAHQAQQKQQILIETLTAQLETSQAQVAQLERDCALTKQKYDQQIQDLRQSENACRDLRSRLHRQQQYTLQFKAALEKCLDVTATQKIEESVDQAISEDESRSESIGFVRAQPVQPWSTTLDSDPWNLEPVSTNIAVPADSVWATAPDDDSLFEEESIAAETFELPEEVIEEFQIPQPEPIVIHPPLSYMIARSTEEAPTVRHNIDLFVPSASQSVEPPAVQEPILEPEITVIQSISVEESSPLESAAAIEEIAANPFNLALPPAVEPTIAAPSPFITLSDRDRSTEPYVAPTSESSPSPVVYPERSQKKRESLAAVELPSFPRSGQ
ncbi:hypothetical protein [Leptolyngbya sp. NIES-2104]|uniref:hypothetical protein n=1 Tax=Leptolyngbya sp. NIES-2104 TaxID=1552121 RepID=UPI0006EC533A|nr:hypothetical protein [Leptolyngbya sp. NIES-2104]GAP95727.1 hypothetical protein NIES2104_22510 [Leptolyngbya sp. NIES-2104]